MRAKELLRDGGRLIIVGLTRVDGLGDIGVPTAAPTLTWKNRLRPSGLRSYF